MKSYLKSDLHKRFLELNYKWTSFHMIGVRSAADAPDQFDDKFYFINEFRNGSMLETSCTTNPGVYWLKNFLNPEGTAVLKPGQYLDSWKLGKHKGIYEALVQAKPVTVYRDTDKDNKAEEQGKEDTGMFGINIHRANSSAVSTIINQWSAGCQVINNPADYDKIIDLCKASGFKLFSYTLLKEF
jgi:hypothetical protein